MAARTYQIAPLAKHTATVIFLHGLGDTGAGWQFLVDSLKTELPHVKWLLPTAPTRSITINMGMPMPGWFDIFAFGLNSRDDREGMLETARTIDTYIQAEIRGGVPPERIVLGGFSQGGCMSILGALTARGGDGLFGGQGGWKLGGVVVLSGWLPLRHEFAKMVSPHMSDMPVLMCHGTEDPLVPHVLGKKTGDFLTGLGLPPAEEGKVGAAGLSFKSYKSVGHSACPEEIQDIKQFLMRVLPRD